MKHLGPIIGIVVYLVLQAAVAHHIAIGSVAPDFVVICVVLFGLQRGPIMGSLFGFVVGVIVDLGNPGFLGLNALAKSVLGYGAGRLGAATSPGVLVLFIVFVAAAFVHDFLYLILFMWPRLGSAFAPGEDPSNPNIVKLVVDRRGRAMYFSRSLIPFDRDKRGVAPLKHPGMYAYRRDFLLKYVTLAATPLEEAEQLEQLRALEHGYPIAVIMADARHHGIDTPEQYEAFVRRVKGK